VILIITILGALLLPALSKARERARRASCLNNLKQINMAMRMYANDYNESFPTPRVDDLPCNYWGSTYAMIVYNQLLGVVISPSIKRVTASYLRDTSIFVCPSQRKHKKSPYIGLTSTDHYSYAVGLKYTGSYNGFTSEDVHNYPFFVLLVDRHLQRFGGWSWSGIGPSGAPLKALEMKPEDNHGVDGVNACFLDGSAKWISSYKKEVNGVIYYVLSMSDNYDGIPNLGNSEYFPNPKYPMMVDIYD
jgi:type II secretory pathway pseudopilin PulG